jgi:2-polyprenyl-3-methyl-5-hydroxy-6-metoxy-1,4-benzoquinol methylase
MSLALIHSFRKTSFIRTARVLKCEVDEIEGQFDVVMMHHGLEHIWDQHTTAADLGRPVKTGGRCLIRIHQFMIGGAFRRRRNARSLANVAEIRANLPISPKD